MLTIAFYGSDYYKVAFNLKNLNVLVNVLHTR